MLFYYNRTLITCFQEYLPRFHVQNKHLKIWPHYVEMRRTVIVCVSSHTGRAKALNCRHMT